MDRETVDFRRSATIAASAGDQIGASDVRSAEPRILPSRTLELRDRSYGRDRQTAQQMPSHPREAASQPRNSVQTVPIQSILKGAREAIIDFDGAAYRLRITRNHRLILTK